ncbi:hypothetical protein M408DRAFT_164071 [Serendipita vermifera MAFF 305830]|uniref:Uncharacterized protein n=1 Tax=Serendipita vermifera MAFF 305830 TaxID=933852 RepID=A0A0C3B6I7_SERVB|nr:hypothetical protein M408DRAFT_164071 [Serendipita vermifera MAFF 305830]
MPSTPFTSYPPPKSWLKWKSHLALSRFYGWYSVTRECFFTLTLRFRPLTVGCLVVSCQACGTIKRSLWW